MTVYKFSNVSGFKNYQKYNDFLAGNPAVILDKGSMFPLGVFTLSAAQTNIEFTNIPQTYTHLQIRGISRSNNASNTYSLGIRFNGDTGNNYARHVLYGDGASALATATTSTNIQYIAWTTGTTPTNNFSANVIDILDYKNTNKNTTVRVLGGGDNNGNGTISLSSGLWMNTAAVTSITLTTGGFGDLLTNTSFALYGVQA